MERIGQWKSWVTPFTAATFMVVGLTGVLMLFEVRLPFIKGFHEWIGLAFVISSLFHVAIHWKTLCNYLKRRETMLALGLVAILIVMLMVVGGNSGPHGPGGPHGRPMSVEYNEE